ncbi:MAG: hypothetical protein KIT84_25240 [Labilithrix sp.]|nr:hypothetical protein [Labilithrix sp.]MCW5814357.1 hypothetical protein [Labilithrix sp.]
MSHALAGGEHSFWPIPALRTLIRAMDERRRRRSSDPLVALHYQLSSVRSAGDLDAIVVADPSGVVVAGAGSWPVCEELAAYAPLLADGEWSSLSTTVSSRVEALRHEVDVRTVSIAGQDVLLCTRQKRRDPNADTHVDHAARGITRILTEAAA